MDSLRPLVPLSSSGHQPVKGATEVAIATIRTLELLYSLRTTLEVSQNLDQEDRDLIMRLSPLYEQRLEEATQQGIQQGIQQGQRVVVENLLRVRFGSLDEQLSAIIEPMLSLPSEEFTPLLLQLLAHGCNLTSTINKVIITLLDIIMC